MYISFCSGKRVVLLSKEEEPGPREFRSKDMESPWVRDDRIKVKQSTTTVTIEPRRVVVEETQSALGNSSPPLLLASLLTQMNKKRAVGLTTRFKKLLLCFVASYGSHFSVALMLSLFRVMTLNVPIHAWDACVKLKNDISGLNAGAKRRGLSSDGGERLEQWETSLVDINRKDLFRRFLDGEKSALFIKSYAILHGYIGKMNTKQLGSSSIVQLELALGAHQFDVAMMIVKATNLDPESEASRHTMLEPITEEDVLLRLKRLQGLHPPKVADSSTTLMKSKAPSFTPTTPSPLIISWKAEQLAIVNNQHHLLREIGHASRGSPPYFSLGSISLGRHSDSVHFAVLAGSVEVFQFLIEEEKYSVDSLDSKKHTPLSYAVGNISLMRYLMKAGAQVTTVEPHHPTLVTLARVLVLEQGPGPDLLRRTRWVDKTSTTEGNDLSDIVDLLVKSGASLDGGSLSGGSRVEPGPTSQSPLCIAVCGGVTPLVNELLKRGANADFLVGKREATLLHLAAEKGFRDIFELLLIHFTGGGKNHPARSVKDCLALRDKFEMTVLDSALSSPDILSSPVVTSSVFTYVLTELLVCDAPADACNGPLSPQTALELLQSRDPFGDTPLHKVVRLCVDLGDYAKLVALSDCMRRLFNESKSSNPAPPWEVKDAEGFSPHELLKRLDPNAPETFHFDH